MLYVILYPTTKLGIALFPFSQPGSKVLLGFLEISPIIKPSQLGEAVIVSLSWEMVESIAQEVNVAALPGGFWEHFLNGLDQAAVVIGNRELDTAQASFFQ